MATSLESRIEQVEKAIRRRNRREVYRWLDVQPGETTAEAEARICAEEKGAEVHLICWLDAGESR